ncbi:MAG: hypothetical protein ACI89X_004469, partial [Planctomycetota bacterium]
ASAARHVATAVLLSELFEEDHRPQATLRVAILRTVLQAEANRVKTAIDKALGS